jgi:L-threonylcarbamoyladenylate synthase
MTPKLKSNLRRLRVDPAAPEPEVIAAAAECLRQGGLVLLPTDTVYGIAGDPAVPGVEKLIGKAKSRDPDKPIPLLAAGIDELRRLGAEPGAAEQALAAAFWPGPLTMVLRLGERDEGCRVPDHPVALALIRAAGGLLRVTSANRSGEPDALDADAAAAALGDAAMLVLDAGPSPGGLASSVVRVDDGQVCILRESAISADQLHKCLKRAGVADADCRGSSGEA